MAFPVIRFPAAECEPRGAVDRAGHLGVHEQQQKGLYYVGVVVPVGWLPTAQARALSHIADQYGSGEIRLTVWQNLLLPNIAEKDLGPVQDALHEAGLQFVAGRVLSGTVACTGSRGCRFAATDTKGHALELANALDAQFTLAHPVNLHVTGCSNSCAQHYIGDIGLMGVKVDGGEGYQVNLGGGADNDQAIARELFPAMAYGDVLPTLNRLFTAFSTYSGEAESFLDFARRHSLDELRAMSTATAVQ